MQVHVVMRGRGIESQPQSGRVDLLDSIVAQTPRQASLMHPSGGGGGGREIVHHGRLVQVVRTARGRMLQGSMLLRLRDGSTAGRGRGRQVARRAGDIGHG